MPSLPSLLIGFAAGVLLAAVLARSFVRRYLSRLRAAELRARASERLAEIGAMTGGLAHEIKNPLSTIGLNAQLLTESINDLDIPADEKGRLARRVGSLQREADRLRGILTDFLQYAGQLRIDPHPTDLNTVVEELSDFFMPQAQAQGVRMRLDLAKGPLMASLDVPQFKQAVLNLLLNAVQAMADPSAGPVKELILRSAREVGEGRRPLVALHIIDTGPGIPPDARDKIFQPYYTTKSGGTGLGLPTTRRLVEGHEGRLEVHSEPGRGSDFTILLPAI